MPRRRFPVDFDLDTPTVDDVVFAHDVTTNANKKFEVGDIVDLFDTAYATQAELDALVISGGGISIASEAEAIAGSNNTKAITPARLAHVLPFDNPERDGAAGDGVTVDTVAVQAALNRGGTVLFPPGNWVIGNLTLTDGAKIGGSGEGRTTLTAAAGTTGNLITCGTYTQVRDLTLDGNGEDVTLIYAFEAARSKFDHLYLTDATNGIVMEGTDAANASHAVQFSDIAIITMSGYGFHADGGFTYDGKVTNLWVGPCNVGVRIESGAWQMANVHVWGCTSNGIEIPSELHMMTNVYSESNGGWGIISDHAGRHSVIGHGRIWNNVDGGIYINGGAYADVSHLQASDNTGPGIHLNDHLHGAVVGNHCYQSGAETQSHGILTTGTTDYTAVIGNHALDSEHTTAGILLAGGAHDKVHHNITSTTRENVLMHSVAGQASQTYIDAPAGQVRDLVFRTDQSNRWIIRTDGTAESGSNAGSDFSIIGRTDAGGSLSTPVSIIRSTGETRISRLRHTGTVLSFNNAAGITKPTVSGSRGGNAALASLLTALSNYGLITDSTSA